MSRFSLLSDIKFNWFKMKRKNILIQNIVVLI